MKKLSVIFKVTVFAACVLAGGAVVREELIGVRGGASSSHTFGNYWVSYSVMNRGLLGERLERMFLASEAPRKQIFEDGEWTLGFRNGKEFTFEAAKGEVYLVDVESGPEALDIDISGEMALRIRSRRESLKGAAFNNVESLAASLQN